MSNDSGHPILEFLDSVNVSEQPCSVVIGQRFDRSAGRRGEGEGGIIQIGSCRTNHKKDFFFFNLSSTYT